MPSAITGMANGAGSSAEPGPDRVRDRSRPLNPHCSPAPARGDNDASSGWPPVMWVCSPAPARGDNGRSRRHSRRSAGDGVNDEAQPRGNRPAVSASRCSALLCIYRDANWITLNYVRRMFDPVGHNDPRIVAVRQWDYIVTGKDRLLGVSVPGNYRRNLKLIPIRLFKYHRTARKTRIVVTI